MRAYVCFLCKILYFLLNAALLCVFCCCSSHFSFSPFLFLFFFVLRMEIKLLLCHRDTYLGRSFLFTFIQLALIHRHGLVVTTTATIAVAVAATSVNVLRAVSNVHTRTHKQYIYSFVARVEFSFSLWTIASDVLLHI